MTSAVAVKKSAQDSQLEMLALIGTAIALTLEKPHKILSVQELNMHPETPLYILNPWSMEGRFQLFSSHRVR